MTHMEELTELLHQRGMIRPRDAAKLGIAPEYFQRLSAAGRIERVSRGLYRLVEAPLSEHHDLALVAARVPHGTICLLSALAFHRLGTQLPFEVWLAVGRNAGVPRLELPHIRLMRFSADTFTTGVETHLIEGVQVKVFSPAKTVADCFKFRNQIGLDVALEALREYRRGRRGTLDELWRMAQVCRVANVMRPYLEAIE